MRKLMQKLIMYYEVHKLKREGFKAAQISRHLILDYRTIKKYLAMSEEEYQDFLEVQSSRHKILAPYEDYVKARLEDCKDASAAQVHDWLKESFDDFIDVNAKTVFKRILKQVRALASVMEMVDTTTKTLLTTLTSTDSRFGWDNRLNS
jgi:hypothetical protein